MTTPNKLTVFRLILVPVFFIWFFLSDKIPVLIYTVVIALIYSVAEFTDFLDGKIARKTGQVTDLGKVMDPFSDVMSHLTYFVCLYSCSLMPIWAFVIILWREFSQSFLRMLLISKGTVMAANFAGKAKTCLYAAVSVCGLATRCAVLYGSQQEWMYKTVFVLSFCAVFASVFSFAVYLSKVIKSGALKNLTR